jgi:hypothetical protein
MTRQEFQQLRDLPGKEITGDIQFAQSNHTRPTLTFENVHVDNALGIEVLVNGAYLPDTGKTSFNFHIKSAFGPVCRVCVNGPIHPGAGRTHKHDLRKDSDPRQNLPTAIERTDLENKTPRQIWDTILEQANITHTGRFQDP